MIFLTVGTQLPFDRLVSAIDDFAGKNSGTEVFAQIGRSKLAPKNLRWTDFMSAHEFKDHFQSAEVIVSHAGMGTILTALDLGKPLVMVPRRAALKEHRNDHQLATAEKMSRFDLVHAADDPETIHNALENLSARKVCSDECGRVSAELIDTIRNFFTYELESPWALNCH